MFYLISSISLYLILSILFGLYGLFISKIVKVSRLPSLSTNDS